MKPSPARSAGARAAVADSPVADAAPAGPLLSDLEQDPDVDMLLDGFVASLPEYIDALERAVTRRDLPTSAMLAHRLRGTAAMYGFPSLAESAERLESLANANSDSASLRVRVAHLAALCDRAARGRMREKSLQPRRPS